MQKLEIEEFLKFSDSNPIIDVRSPSEYRGGHIPGAINIPLFSDMERAEIGTLYKHEGKQRAIIRGLEIVGPKMSIFVKEASQLKSKHQLLVHCWRGGMRSESFTWLMNTSGLNAKSLVGGYKSYRNHILSGLSSTCKLILLTGSTGTGKTEILQHLESLGEQVIDLEALACHKGSVFGGLGQVEQPTTEQFQNNLFNCFERLDHTRRIWIEDESIGIGNVQIPQEFWRQMTQSPFIRIEINKEERINRLVNEYGLFPQEDLENKIIQISKRLGGLDTKLAIEHLRKGNISTTTECLLNYYDKAYNNCIDRKNPSLGRSLVFENFDGNVIAQNLIEEADKEIEEVLNESN